VFVVKLHCAIVGSYKGADKDLNLLEYKTLSTGENTYLLQMLATSKYIAYVVHEE
jgi:hypothetical protein